MRGLPINIFYFYRFLIKKFKKIPKWQDFDQILGQIWLFLAILGQNLGGGISEKHIFLAQINFYPFVEKFFEKNCFSNFSFKKIAKRAQIWLKSNSNLIILAKN